MSSKIGIIGDTHFGAGYNMGKLDSKTQMNTRLLDFANTFNKIIDAHVKRQVKIVVLTGDIFETRHPTATQHKIFSRCVQRAVDLGITILINVGNHDQQRHVDTTTVDIYNSLKIPGVYVFQEMGVHVVDNTNIIVMPYRDRRMLGGKTSPDAVKTLIREFESLTSNLKGNKIVVGHFMLEKGQDLDPDLFSMDELVLPLAMFYDCDAVVMGHIHKHNVVSEQNPIVIYSGSMEKVTFGEKDHNKVSIIFDTNNIQKPEIIKTKTRNLYEISFDYSDLDPFKSLINEHVTKDIDDFKGNLKGSICKVMVRIKERDLYYIDQSLIRSHMASKGIKYCTGVQVSAVSSRQLRNNTIDETISGKKAMISFVEGLLIGDQMKKKLLKYAEKVIDEVEVK